MVGLVVASALGAFIWNDARLPLIHAEDEYHYDEANLDDPPRK